MTDKEFQLKFDVMTFDQKFKWLGEKTRSITMKKGQSYNIQSIEDLIAVIEQEMYEELTGRQ